MAWMRACGCDWVRLCRGGLLILLALGLGVTSLPAGAGESDELPEVLLRHGFDDPQASITVVFVSPAGESEDHPKLVGSDAVAPPNTLWVFDDPAPVRTVLARAKTRKFAAGLFPGAEARLIVYAGPEGAGARIYLNYRPGWGVVKANAKTGGEWYFDPAADRALVGLLSRTAPRAIGYPVRSVIEAAWKPDAPIAGSDVATFAASADWARLKKRIVTRYASAALTLPKDFSWDTHFVAVAWLAPRNSRDRLDWGGGRIAGNTITWELREHAKEEEAKDYAPLTIGFFRKPEASPARFAVRLGGRVVKNEYVSLRMRMPGDPEGVGLLVPRSADGVRLGVIGIFADRTWRYEPDGDDREGSGCQEGKVPADIAEALFGGLGQWKTHQGKVAMHDVRLGGDDTIPPLPPGTRALLEHLGLVQ